MRVAKQVYVTHQVNALLMAEGKRRKLSQQELLAEIIEEAVLRRESVQWMT
jgi:hypothetical protein